MKCPWCSREFEAYGILTVHEQIEHPREYWTGKVRYHERQASIHQSKAKQAREKLTSVKASI